MRTSGPFDNLDAQVTHLIDFRLAFQDAWRHLDLDVSCDLIQLEYSPLVGSRVIQEFLGMHAVEPDGQIVAFVVVVEETLLIHLDH